MAIKKNTAKKITSADRRKAEQLETEVKLWAKALHRSQKSIRASIAAGTLYFRRGKLWIVTGKRR